MTHTTKAEHDWKSRAQITINASAEKVWQALTDPNIIKQYLFGTDVKTDWKVGSEITYTGEWEGKQYQDKGKILEIVPNKRIVSTYWSSMSGEVDTPENYKNVTYELHEENAKTQVKITQDNNKTKEAMEHTTINWNMVLDKMKEILEK